MGSFWCLYCKLYITACPSVFIVNFEQVNADWIISRLDHYRSFSLLETSGEPRAGFEPGPTVQALLDEFV